MTISVDLRKKIVQQLDPTLTKNSVIKSPSEMDAPENMKTLYNLGKLAAERDVKAGDFASVFDSPMS